MHGEADFVGLVQISKATILEAGDKPCGALYAGRVVDQLKGKRRTTIEFGHSPGLRFGAEYVVFLTKPGPPHHSFMSTNSIHQRARTEERTRCAAQQTGWWVMHSGIAALLSLAAEEFGYEPALAVPTRYVTFPEDVPSQPADLGFLYEFSEMRWVKRDTALGVLRALKKADESGAGAQTDRCQAGQARGGPAADAQGPTRKHLPLRAAAAGVERVRAEWDPSMASQIAAHVTVAYPQEFPDAGLLAARLRDAAPLVPRFRLQLGAISCFGRPEDGVYVEVDDVDGGLSRLRTVMLEPPCEPLDVPPTSRSSTRGPPTVGASTGSRRAARASLRSSRWSRSRSPDSAGAGGRW